MTTVHLLHTQRLIREGLSKLLQRTHDISISGESKSTSELFKRIEDGLQADTILMALPVPELRSIDYQEIKTRTGAKLLVMASIKDSVCPSNAIQAGADGSILDDVSPDEIVFAIRYVMEGKKYLSPPIGLAFQKFALPFVDLNENFNLSSREIEIFRLIGEGLTNQEIADKIFTSKRTVEGHRNNLLKKTGARNAAALMRYMYQGLDAQIPAIARDIVEQSSSIGSDGR